MKDEEVGKLWSKLKSDCGKGDECDNHGQTFQLIRKLVEERAEKLYHLEMPTAENRQASLWLALRDFGIDPDTWKMKLTIEVKDPKEAEAIKRALADPDIRPLVAVMGELLALSDPHAQSLLDELEEVLEDMQHAARTLGVKDE